MCSLWVLGEERVTFVYMRYLPWIILSTARLLSRWMRMEERLREDSDTTGWV